MKNLILTLAIILAAAWSLNQYRPVLVKEFDKLAYQSVCDKPIRYAIGETDPRFNLNRDQFLTDAKQAAAVWNKAYGGDLFVYDPGATLKINLVFDERQQLSNQINQLEGKLTNQKNNLSPEIARYEQDVESFKKQLQDLNNQVEYWNGLGGAPANVYDELIKRRQALEQEAEKLNRRAKELNQSAVNYNLQIGQLNQTVSNFNQTLQAKPEEGLYDPTKNSINIYFNNNQAELIHTLAHELGHARGLEHNQNPKSIMYPLTSQITTPAKDDLDELAEICRKRNLLELLREKLIRLESFKEL